jgi:hypothetical protein
MTKHIEARRLYEATGNATAAHAIAMQDEGLLRPIPLNEWVAFIDGCIARDAETDRAYQ